jgi:ribonuclease HI
MKPVKIYTDGACSGNPGPGGWGAFLVYGNKTKEIFGSEPNTTNNRMELLAAIKGLQELKVKCLVELYTDSNYLKDGITSWIFNWQRNDWRTANNKPVKNKDLWLELLDLIKNHEITWHWVKGHSGHDGNEIADKLAVRGRDEAATIN